VTTPNAQRSVLLVEDDFLQAQSTASILDDAGARVVGPFGSFGDAEEVLTRRPVDCAVLDLDLGDGLDTAPARKLHNEGVPVVLITGYGPDILPAELQMLVLVEKPYTPSLLLDAVSRALQPFQ